MADIIRRFAQWFNGQIARQSVESTTPPKFDPTIATLDETELQLLRRLVCESANNDGPIIEIGTLIGRTTTEISLASNDSQSIITVDNYCWNPWGLDADTHFSVAAQVLRYLVARDKVQHVRMDKTAFFQSYDGASPALVFLDAWHTYDETKKDIEWAQKIGANCICGHDYCDEFPGVIQVVKEFGGPRELAGSLWVL